MMIEVRDLTKRYGPTVAVDALSFDVRPGAVTGFLGANGSGKSTTMRLILGLDAASSGSVTVGGRPYASCRRPLTVAGATVVAWAGLTKTGWSAVLGESGDPAAVLCLSLGSGSLDGGIVGRVHRDDRRPEVETGAPQVAAPT